jgi:dTDP-4-dehydrorhamnose 3,5-epimerase
LKILKTKIKGLQIIKYKNHSDNRGYFKEIFKSKLFNNKNFIFWSLSMSKKNVIRGIHFQKKLAQDKYVSIIKGKVFDLVVDLRKKSKTYGKTFSIILSEKNNTSLFIPSGFGHGFCGLDKENIVLYGCTKYRSIKNETGILWNDKHLKIKWPIKKPIVSIKDKKNISFLNFRNNKYK